MVVRTYTSHVLVTAKTAKGQVFFRRLFKRQKSLVNGFSVTHICPRVL